jgi:hypothetical protein
MRSVVFSVVSMLLGCTVAMSFSSESPGLLTILKGGMPGEHLGGVIAGAGDVNGDGLSDLIVGDDREGTLIGERRCFLYYGSPFLDSIPDVTIPQPELDTLYYPSGMDDRFGKVVSGGGDLNGDGLHS